MEEGASKDESREAGVGGGASSIRSEMSWDDDVERDVVGRGEGEGRGNMNPVAPGCDLCWDGGDDKDSWGVTFQYFPWTDGLSRAPSLF